MGLKLSGSFAPNGVNRVKVSRTTLPDFFEYGFTTSNLYTQSFGASELQIPSANNKWMSWDGTNTMAGYQDITGSAELQIPSANNKWMSWDGTNTMAGYQDITGSAELQIPSANNKWMSTWIES